MPQTIFQLFAEHRTIRHFLRKPLPENDVDRILTAAQRAPTDASAQMYSIIRVTHTALRDEIATLSGEQQHIRDCGEFFVICLDVHRLDKLLKRRGTRLGMGPRVSILYGTTDAILAAANLALAAEAIGYGTCFIGGVQNRIDRLSQLLALPRGVLPIVGLCVGVPDPDWIPAQPRPRLPKAFVVHENGYRLFRNDDLEAAYTAMAPISRRKDWFPTLERYFAPDGTMARREAVMAAAWRQQGFEPEG